VCNVNSTFKETNNNRLQVKIVETNIDPIQITPEEFENGGFTLKTQQMFSVHTTLEEFKNATITGHFGFVFEETVGRDHMIYHDTIIFENHRFQNVFFPH